MHSRTSRRNGCSSDERSFHQLLNAVGENRLEWLRIVKKEHLCGTLRLKSFSSKKRCVQCIVVTRQIVIWFKVLVHWGEKNSNFGSKKNKKKSQIGPKVAGKIRHRVANALPPLQPFFSKSTLLLPGCNDAEICPASSLRARRSTASMMKDLIWSISEIYFGNFKIGKLKNWV